MRVKDFKIKERITVMFLARYEVKEKIEDAIINKHILLITYKHAEPENDIVKRRKAPFDLGTTNPKRILQNKDMLYAFCFQHREKDTGLLLPIVHPINSLRIITIEDTEEEFDPVELTEINKRNTKDNYDYRQWKWALVPERNWY